MTLLVRHIYTVLAHLGGFGLLGLGALDSSLFLFAPYGNDLLMVAMTARHHAMLPYYAVMAAAGSVLGCAVTDLICRKGGEAGLDRRLSKRRLAYVKKQFRRHAGWTLAFSALVPPPFPFTAFVAGAAALGYPRKRLLAVIGASRFLRFSLEGLLAIWFGRRILGLADSRVVEGVVILLIVVTLAGSAISISSWVKGSRKA